MTEPQFSTERLVISRLLPSDAEAFFAYRSMPDVCLFQPFEPTRMADVFEFIGDPETLLFDTPGTWFPFGVRLKEGGTLIGDVGTHFMTDECQVEIGFTVSPDYQGRGYGTEAAYGLLDFLFSVHRKHRVFGSVDPRNEPSIALLERIGMRREAHFKESYWFKGRWVDDIVFGILRSEWEAR